MAEQQSKRRKVEVEPTGPKTPINVGILGVTGTVGQRFVSLLANHPWFKIHTIGASKRSAGNAYGKIVKWKLTAKLPDNIKTTPIVTCTPSEFTGCRIIFSAMDSSVAGPIETDFAAAGFAVFSNAKNHRYDSDVPILLPHANADHLNIIKHQKSYSNGKGFIVTNANCSSTGLAIALAPLHKAFGLERLFVVTLQAISGAGYPGVASLDILDNVVPYISGEEPKLEMEPQKILGTCTESSIQPADFTVSAMCNRVAVVDGHTECVSIKFRTPTTLEQVQETLSNHTSEAQQMKLPSAPSAPIFVFAEDEPTRPQPKLDRDLEDGYVVTVGRVRECNLLDYKFTLCSHNTVIGAAGGSILNAELAYARALL